MRDLGQGHTVGLEGALRLAPKTSLHSMRHKNRNHGHNEDYKSKEEDEPTPPSNVVLVKGIEPTISEETVLEYAKIYGPVESVKIGKNKMTGERKDYAFVIFSTVDDATAFMTHHPEGTATIQGHKLSLAFSKRAKEITASASDWICPNCSGVNYSRRIECYRCRTPKPAYPALARPFEASHISPCATLIITGLAPYTTEQSIYAVFNAIACVKDIRLVFDRVTHASRRCAFIEFFNVDTATYVLQQCSALSIDGVNVRVSYAREHCHTPHTYTDPAYAQWYYSQYYSADATYHSQYPQPSADDVAKFLRNVAEGTSADSVTTTPASNLTTASSDTSAVPPHDSNPPPLTPKPTQRHPHPLNPAFFFDPPTGLYFNPSLSMYWDPQSNLFTKDGKWLRYDATLGTYLPADPPTPAASLNPPSAAAAVAEPAATTAEKPKKGKKPAASGQVPQPSKKLTAEMEKWSLKRKELVEQLEQEEHHGEEEEVHHDKAATADESDKRTKRHVPHKQPTGSAEMGQSQPATTTADNEDDALNAQYAVGTTCLLCQRAFPTEAALRKHVGVSDLHRHNLEVEKAKRKTAFVAPTPAPPPAKLTPIEEEAYAVMRQIEEAMFQKQAAEASARSKKPKDKKRKHGMITPGSARGTDSILTDETNLGNKLLRKLGWKGEGDAIGKTNATIAAPLAVSMRTERAGLGMAGAVYGDVADGDLSYQAMAKRKALARFEEVLSKEAADRAMREMRSGDEASNKRPRL